MLPYGVTSDGQRFLVLEAKDRALHPSFTVAVNWQDAPAKTERPLTGPPPPLTDRPFRRAGSREIVVLTRLTSRDQEAQHVR